MRVQRGSCRRIRQGEVVEVCKLAVEVRSRGREGELVLEGSNAIPEGRVNERLLDEGEALGERNGAVKGGGGRVETGGKGREGRGGGRSRVRVKEGEVRGGKGRGDEGGFGGDFGGGLRGGSVER